MRAPATSGARVDHGQARKPSAKKTQTRRPAAASARKAKRSREPEIKITRNSKRPQIKASRGPGAGAASAKRKPAQRDSAQRDSAQRNSTQRRTLDRAAETRRQSLNSLNADYGRGTRSRSRSAAPAGGGGGVRAVAVGAGGVAVGAARVASEVARPAAAAAARPMLRVISGGIDKLPTGAAAQPFARGRAMILIAAVLGAGLIYINVGKLQGGDAYGKYSARSAVLQRENTALRARIAGLDSVERIQAYAKRFGMQSPLPEQFTYIRARPGDALKGMKNYTTPTNTAVSPTVAPQQASTPDSTNQTPVSGTDQTSTQTTATGAPAQTVSPNAPAAGTQGTAQVQNQNVQSGATAVGGGQ
jgi:hypothetical protein